MGVKFWSSSGVDDKPATEDLLQITAHTDALTEFIRNCAMPMTIAVQGSWGEGKTTVMNIVRYQLENPTKETSEEETPKSVKTAWFNTWQYSQFEMDDTLSLSLLEYLAETCDPNGDMKAIIRACIKGLRKLVWPLAIELSPVKPIKGFTFKAANSPEAAETEETNRIKAIEELKNAFGKLIKKSLGIGKDETEEDKAKRFVVFIDDLDRLNPEKAVEALEVLKLFLENDHCVFVLAIDYDVIVRGVDAKYGDTKGKANIDARKFFDKIIQVPFRLPVANYQLSNFVLQCMKGIYPKNPEEEEEKAYEDRLKPIADSYVTLIQLSIGGNPRSVKRLLNAFQLQLYAMRSFDKPAQKRLEELKERDKLTEPERAKLKKLKKRGNLTEKEREELEELEKLRKLEETRKKLLFALCCLQLYNENMYDVIARRLNANETEITSLLTLFKGTQSDTDNIDFGDKQDFFKAMLAILDEAVKDMTDEKEKTAVQVQLLKSVVNASSVTASETQENRSFVRNHAVSESDYKNKRLALGPVLECGKLVHVQWGDIKHDRLVNSYVKGLITGMTEFFESNKVEVGTKLIVNYDSGENLLTISEA